MTYQIDHDTRLVSARGSGTLTDTEVFGYHHEVWSRADVIGYQELIDMTDVMEIKVLSMDRVRELARVGTAMDFAAVPGKLAVAAPGDHAYGLARMFETYRSIESGGQKQIGIFRTLHEALVFLGITEPLPLEKPAPQAIHAESPAMDD